MAVIMFAFEKRDDMYRLFVTQEAAHNASHIEEKWTGDDHDISDVAELSEEQLGVIPNLSGESVTAERNIFGASAGIGEITIEEQIYDPENDMRRNSVIKKLFSKKDE